MNPLMENGSLRRIEPEDLFGLDKELDPSFNCKQIWAEWAKVWLQSSHFAAALFCKLLIAEFDGRVAKLLVQG